MTHSVPLSDRPTVYLKDINSTSATKNYSLSRRFLFSSGSTFKSSKFMEIRTVCSDRGDFILSALVWSTAFTSSTGSIQYLKHLLSGTPQEKQFSLGNATYRYQTAGKIPAIAAASLTHSGWQRPRQKAGASPAHGEGLGSS